MEFNFIKGSRKKIWGCSDDSKYGEFILGQSEQQFKIQSYFGIFDPVIGEVHYMMMQNHMLLNV